MYFGSVRFSEAPEETASDTAGLGDDGTGKDEEDKIGDDGEDIVDDNDDVIDGECSFCSLDSVTDNEDESCRSTTEGLEDDEADAIALTCDAVVVGLGLHLTPDP